MRALLILPLLAACAGCMVPTYIDGEGIARRDQQRREAEMEAMRRCPTGTVEPRPDRGRPSDGRVPSDYECKRPGS